jgi:phosphohistidine phosphatase SixA
MGKIFKLAYSYVHYSRILVAISALFILLSACSTTTLYVVRHAEKAAPNNTMNTDVDLSPAGQARARTLRDSLKERTLGALFATQYKRTYQTLEPLAQAKNMTIVRYQAASYNTLIDSLARIKGKAFTIAGHSNTVPGMLRHIGLQPSMQEIPDSIYNLLFVVSIVWKNGQRQLTLTEKTYGAPSP